MRQDDPDEIAKRAAIVREAGIRARFDGRIAPTLAELNEALGDEAGVSNQARIEAGKTPKRYGAIPRIAAEKGGRRAKHHGPRNGHRGPRE